MTGVSWRAGCPVPLRDLRLIAAPHWGFDGRVHRGRLIVHEDVARDGVGRAPTPLRGTLPDPANGSGGRVRRQRLPLDRGGQHVGVQLPLRRGDEPLVGARLRPRDRPQPDREPVRQRWSHVASRERAVPRPLAGAAGNGVRGRRARARHSPRSAGAGAATGPASRTTSTSPRAAADAVTTRSIRFQRRQQCCLPPDGKKRATGLEPATSSLEGWRSTN